MLVSSPAPLSPPILFSSPSPHVSPALSIRTWKINGRWRRSRRFPFFKLLLRCSPLIVADLSITMLERTDSLFYMNPSLGRSIEHDTRHTAFLFNDYRHEEGNRVNSRWLVDVFFLFRFFYSISVRTTQQHTSAHHFLPLVPIIRHAQFIVPVSFRFDIAIKPLCRNAQLQTILRRRNIAAEGGATLIRKTNFNYFSSL